MEQVIKKETTTQAQIQKSEEKNVQVKSIFQSSLNSVYLTEHEQVAEACAVLSNN